MGYIITIGEAYINDDRDGHVRILAHVETNPNAPSHCPYTGIGNQRSPSYGQWSEFCRDAGIETLFYGKGWSQIERGYLPCPDDFHRETPLFADHPGASRILPEDLEYIRQARIKREHSNGGRKPGFISTPDDDQTVDSTLARLLWLEFWMNWALLNCKIPIIENR